MIHYNDLSGLADRIAEEIGSPMKAGAIFRVLDSFYTEQQLETLCSRLFNGDDDISEFRFIGDVMKNSGGKFNPCDIRDWYRKKTLEIATANGEKPFYVDDYGNDLRYTRD